MGEKDIRERRWISRDAGDRHTGSGWIGGAGIQEWIGRDPRDMGWMGRDMGDRDVGDGMDGEGHGGTEGQGRGPGTAAAGGGSGTATGMGDGPPPAAISKPVVRRPWCRIRPRCKICPLPCGTWPLCRIRPLRAGHGCGQDLALDRTWFPWTGYDPLNVGHGPCAGYGPGAGQGHVPASPPRPPRQLPTGMDTRGVSCTVGPAGGCPGVPPPCQHVAGPQGPSAPGRVVHQTPAFPSGRATALPIPSSLCQGTDPALPLRQCPAAQAGSSSSARQPLARSLCQALLHTCSKPHCTLALSEPQCTLAVSTKPCCTLVKSSKPRCTLARSPKPHCTLAVSCKPCCTLTRSPKPCRTLATSAKPRCTLAASSSSQDHQHPTSK